MGSEITPSLDKILSVSPISTYRILIGEISGHP